VGLKFTGYETDCNNQIYYYYIYYFLWLCSPAWAMASSGSAAQRGLWPPLALQPSAGYGLLWLCSPARAIVSSVSASQRVIWPPLPLQPSAGYGLLWLCSPARAMASSGSVAQCGLWPPRLRGFLFTHNYAPRSVGLLWTSDQIIAETFTSIFFQFGFNCSDRRPYFGFML
jgi:hypothetical protein